MNSDVTTKLTRDRDVSVIGLFNFARMNEQVGLSVVVVRPVQVHVAVDLDVRPAGVRDLELDVDVLARVIVPLQPDEKYLFVFIIVYDVSWNVAGLFMSEVNNCLKSNILFGFLFKYKVVLLQPDETYLWKILINFEKIFPRCFVAS